MSRPLGLSAYRALSRRNPAHPYLPTTQRPNGELIWIHAPEKGGGPAALALACRMIGARDGVSVLFTNGEKENTPVSSDPNNLIRDVVPADHPDSTAAFIAHWAPDAVLWLWGALRPNLVLECADADIPMILGNAEADGFEGRRDRWLREVPRALLTRFEKVIARSDIASARLAQMGCSNAQLEQDAPLHFSGAALPFSVSDFDELARTLRGRPVWCATAVQPGEVNTVLKAHRHAMRLSHRLLLILNLADETQEQECIETIAQQGMRKAIWENGEFPDDNCQVLLACSQGELGLWYRVAPVSFLGSSLAAGKGGLDPMHAASLGTAVLYGPNVRNHLHAFSQLASAGAARIVNDANALGVAVARLIAPDQAATMAMAGWDVVSKSAATTDRLVDLLQDALDAPRKGA
jgi:3-deoxy-D-manno-octulosonic-acid transferase